MYEMLPKEYICAWLKSLTIPSKGGPRDGISRQAVANHTGIPVRTLEHYAGVRGAHLERSQSMSQARQRLLSKLISQVENGNLVFQGVGLAKRAVFVDNPKPRVRYEVKLPERGQAPKLMTVARPQVLGYMPSFKDLLIK